MTDIVKRLQEPPFGTETSERNLMNAAANSIVALRADNTYLAKFILELREKLALFVDEIEDEGDRVYLGSTNHADYLRDAEERMTEIWYEAEAKIGLFAKDRDLYAELREANEKLSALEQHAQNLGDTVVGVFDQMLKGNWVDDHGHDVRMNRAMLSMKGRLGEVMVFRAEHLGYSPVSTTALSAEGEA